MKKNKISVAMCTYNGEKYLNGQLTSIISQSYLPDEIVICDDGSSDDTIKIIENFINKTKINIRLYQNTKNLGSTKNFEKAINLCNGDIIILSDQDDIWYKSKLEIIYKVFQKKNNIGLIFSDADLIDEESYLLPDNLWERVEFKKSEKKKFLNNKSNEVLLKHNVITGATMAFKSEYINLILPIPKCWVHDEWIALYFSILSNCAFIDKSLIKYRQHSEQQIGVQKLNLVEKIFKSNSITSEDYYLQIEKFKKFKSRIKKLDYKVINNEFMEKINNKISHLEKRAKINSYKNRFKKIYFSLHELFNLRYFNYSSGLKSFMKDLILS
jgi:glycosyltransferase involved in cell wall biosynthesis